MTVPTPVFDHLLAECIGRPQAYAALGELCDAVGGRTSGASSGDRAEAWAHALLGAWGLESVRYEPFDVVVWQRGDLDARIESPAAWRLTAVAHGNAPPAVDLTARVIDAGHGERPDYARLGDAVRGKLVLCDEGAGDGRRRLHRSEKLLLAVEHGAAALMIQSSAPGGLPRTGVCHPDRSPIASIGISLEDGERLRRLIRAGAVPTATIRMDNRIGAGTARNVLADLPGRELPGEVILVGGHLDAWDLAQGATDNGLGAAIVLEMARALASADPRPRRTLRFALWAAEETGLRGSKHHAALHAATLPDVKAVLNFDMTGDPYGYWTPGHPEPGPLLRDLARRLAPLGLRDVFEHKAGLHSDHQPFMLAGVPVVGILGDLGEQGGRYYHSAGDTFEKVSLPAFCRAAAVGAITAYALADAPAAPLPHLDPNGVRHMIDAAGLHEALVAEGYDGPPMRVRDEAAAAGSRRTSVPLEPAAARAQNGPAA